MTGKCYYIGASWSKAEEQRWTAYRAQIAAGCDGANGSQRPAGAAANSSRSPPEGLAEPVGEPAESVEELNQNRVLLVSLKLEPYFDELYQPLLDELALRSRLQRVKSAAAATRLLSDKPAPTAVLVTDQALTEAENAGVSEAALRYIRQGGTLVAMGHFSSFTPPLDMNRFFAKAGLVWEAGSYDRTRLSLNRAAVEGVMASKLPSKYSQKALAVKHAAPGEVWYRITANSSPTNAYSLYESPITLAKVGNGKLGYVGDVNAEEESNLVILAMCGLL